MPHAQVWTRLLNQSQKQIITLLSSIEQFTEQGTLLRDMDKDVVVTIQAEDELEVEVVESAVI